MPPGTPTATPSTPPPGRRTTTPPHSRRPEAGARLTYRRNRRPAPHPGEHSMSVIRSQVDTRSESFAANTRAMDGALGRVRAAAEAAAAGGGETARDRHISRGKILPRERVARLLDAGSPFLEIGLFAAHDMYDGAAPGAGIVTGIGRVS